MKAARFYGYKDIRVEDISEPEIPAGFVRVRIAWAGICGTDRHEYTGPVWVPMHKPHRITGQMAPLTLGHELSGVIVALGEDVKDWQVGDRVTASGNIYCGTCEMCQSGRVNLCENLAFNGIGRDGAFAEYMVMPAYQLYKVPDAVSLEQAVLAEPLACGWHATKALGDLKGKNVAVVGPGIIGLSCVIAAREAGAQTIMVCGLGRDNEKIARLMGATHYVDSREQDPVEEGKRITAKPGFDAVYECVGVQSSLNMAMELLRKSAKLMVMGVFEKMPEFNMNIFQEGERTLYTSQAYADEIREILVMMEKQTLPVEKLITARIQLERIVEDGFEELLRNPARHVKIAVQIKAVD
jgi:(R,R)-butanediol dehydrogenase/meso-butanediol dehydrogenase/diacetyl reductase